MNRKNGFRRAAWVLGLAVFFAGCGGGRPAAVYETGSAPAAESEVSPSAEAAAAVPDGGQEAVPAEAGETDPDVRCEKETAIRQSAAEEDTLCVYICGEVMMPGVYELPEGSRVWQALQAAGGLTEDADVMALNQAALLSDGEQISVLSRDETASLRAAGQLPQTAGSGSAQPGGDAARVNLNTADAETLMTLPGIGQTRADLILRYREEHGGFSGPEELMNIDGIGEKSYQKLQAYITV